MPTNFASNATAPRMRSASAAIISSASGRATNRVSVGLVEPTLEDELRRDCIAGSLTALPVDTGSGKLSVRGEARESLVNATDLQSETTGELSGEALGTCGHLVLAAVSMHRAPHDDYVGSPFVDQRCNCFEARGARLAFDRRQRPRDARQRISY